LRPAVIVGFTLSIVAVFFFTNRKIALEPVDNYFHGFAALMEIFEPSEVMVTFPFKSVR